MVRVRAGSRASTYNASPSLRSSGGEGRMALQAAHQQQRFVRAIGVTPAVDVGGVLLAPRRRQRRDARHAGAGAGWRPRTSLPGRASVGTPFSAMTSPETIVAT